MSLVSLQPPPTPTPSHDDILAVWSRFLGNPDALIAHFNITPTQLLALLAEPAFIDKKAHWDALRLAHLHALAVDHQTAAAAKLRELTASADPAEARKAATSLSRWWPGPPQSPRSSRSRSSSPLATKTSPPAVDEHSDPKEVVASLVTRIRDSAHQNRVDSLAHIVPQLSPNCALDHTRVRPSVLGNPKLLAKLLVDSSLADICSSPEPTITVAKATERSASLQVVNHNDQEFGRYCVDIELFRVDPLAPWLITSISSLHRPRLTPRGSSP